MKLPATNRITALSAWSAIWSRRHSVLLIFLVLAVMYPRVGMFSLDYAFQSKDERIWRTWGDLYRFGQFICERTPSDARILLSTVGMGPHLSNPSLIAYFVFPRRLVLGGQETLQTQEDIQYVVMADDSPSFTVPGTREYYHQGRGIDLRPTVSKRMEVNIDDVRIWTEAEVLFENDYDTNSDSTQIAGDYITRATREIHEHRRSDTGSRSGFSEYFDITYGYAEHDMWRLGVSGKTIFVSPDDDPPVRFSLWERTTGGQMAVALSLLKPGVGLRNINALAIAREDGWVEHVIENLGEAIRKQAPQMNPGRLAVIQLNLLSDERKYPYRDWGLITVNREGL